jgi:hypothetical protein
MNARYVALIFAAGLMVGSCSKKPTPAKPEPTPSREKSEPEEKENEEQPREEEIAEDCVAFVRATKIVPVDGGVDCPGCPGAGSEVLSFRRMRVDGVFCPGPACEVTVILSVSFNSGLRGKIGGGLTGWIPEEQRVGYLNGRAPAGEQDYRVKVIYQRNGEEWRAIEFDRADPK